MVDFTQAFETVVLTHAEVTLGNVAVGESDVFGFLEGALQIFHANVSTTASNLGTEYYVEGTGASGSIDENWTYITTFTTGDAAANRGDMTAAEAAGVASIAVVSSTGFVTGQKVYIEDGTIVGDSEWARCQDVPDSTTVVLFDGLTRAKDSADDVWNQAEVFTLPYESFAGYRRIRVICNHNVSGTGGAIQTKALLTSATDLE